MKGVAESGLLREFLKTVNFDVDERNDNGIVLYSLLRYLSSNPSVSKTCYVDLKSGYVSGYGLFEIDHFHIHMSRRRNEDGEISHYQFIVAEYSNNVNTQMSIFTANSTDRELIEMDCSGMRENVIIDLNREGRRWEGGELNRKPFGFGREYSEDDNLVYEGFMFEGMKVCVGKEWNDDGNNNCLVYEGGYCNNERWGKGTSYDLNGNVDFEGEWMNNVGITGNEKDLMNDLIVPMWIEEFVIGYTLFNDENITTLHFSPLLVRLKRIEIGNQCFDNVREFVIDGLESLESVKIGEYCFRIDEWKERDDGICRIANCPNLRRLEIGWSSFEDFKSFELSNVNSLQSINFSDWCFLLADLSLKGEWKERKKCDLNENENDVLDLPSLEIVHLDRVTFCFCHVAVFESM